MVRVLVMMDSFEVVALVSDLDPSIANELHIVLWLVPHLQHGIDMDPLHLDRT